MRNVLDVRSAPVWVLVASALVAAPSPAVGQCDAERSYGPCIGPPQYADVVYAVVDSRSLLLDLYLPEGLESPPLVVWVHGGAWRSQSKDRLPALFVKHGFATASLDFRLSTEARFPAAVHDIKAGIRFLRANAERYGYSTARIAIAGASSGGHYAALIGVTNGNPDLEGTLGDHLDESSSVDAIISYFGASDLTTVVAQSTPVGLDLRVPALDLLLGAQPENTEALAELASPVFHVDRDDPPLLLLHGDQDLTMPVNQSLELENAYKKLGLDVTLEVPHGSGHYGAEFFTGANADLALAFLRRTIGR